MGASRVFFVCLFFICLLVLYSRGGHGPGRVLPQLRTRESQTLRGRGVLWGVLWDVSVSWCRRFGIPPSSLSARRTFVRRRAIAWC